MKKIRIVQYLVVVLMVVFAGCDKASHDTIQDTLNEMTLEEKIGQMLLVGFNGTSINEELNTLVEDEKVGGLILFKGNIETSSQLKSLVEDIKKLDASVPLFISIDEEGGRVSRLPDDTNKFPSASEIGAKDDEGYSYENGIKMGKVLSNYGINMDFAPVLDIYSNNKNTVIGDRAFGNNEEIVSTMGIAMMKGLQDENIIDCVKHFPGHGDTEVDSHVGLPIVYKNLEELEKFEFIPFKKAIESNCDVVMVSHIVLNEIDSKNPSSLSKTVISGLLRENLGFDKVVITDDMNMSAITNTISVEKASIESIKAGSDIILIGGGLDTITSVIREIESAIKNGDLSEDRIDESVYRILELKSKYLKLK